MMKFKILKWGIRDIQFIFLGLFCLIWNYYQFVYNNPFVTIGGIFFLWIIFNWIINTEQDE